jgi:hypothetical protein
VPLPCLSWKKLMQNAVTIMVTIMHQNAKNGPKKFVRKNLPGQDLFHPVRVSHVLLRHVDLRQNEDGPLAHRVHAGRREKRVL